MSKISEAAHLTTSLQLPGLRLRRYANRIFRPSPIQQTPSSSTSSHLQVRVVCTADTHNSKPNLPPGDILVHAGDLTENGSFDEIQRQLDWLAAQPHQHKIVIAGNHDVLLDESFLVTHPERRYGDLRTLNDLNWHDLIYLEESSIQVDVEQSEHPITASPRTIKIYGSPYTIQYGLSAFQRPPDEDKWTKTIEKGTDIVVCHGPPNQHLDRQGVHNAGDPYLAHEIARIQPRLVIFGHIHVAYGREDLLLDKSVLIHDDILRHWAGWIGLAELAVRVSWCKLQWAVLGRERMMKRGRVTTLVNAAYGGLRNEPVVVDI